MKNPFRKKEKEEGQALLEFVLVIPIFLFCLCLIVDYGWLFYHYISLENSARNAARVACVEYQEVGKNYNESDGKFTSLGPLDLSDPESPKPKLYYINNLEEWEKYTEEEKHILTQVKNTVTSPERVESIVIGYTGDVPEGALFDLDERMDGDVTVVVNYKLRMLIGLTGGGMEKSISSKSTFKVERYAYD